MEVRIISFSNSGTLYAVALQCLISDIPLEHSTLCGEEFHVGHTCNSFPSTVFTPFNDIINDSFPNFPGFYTSGKFYLYCLRSLY